MVTKKSRILILMMILISSVIFYSCSSSSSIIGSWKKPAYSGKKFNKVIVLAVGKNIVIRSTMEKEIVSRLKEIKVTAAAGSDIITQEMIEFDKDNKVTEKTKTMVLEKIKENYFDGALIIALKDIKESEHYVPGTVYRPYPGYGTFYNFYYASYGAAYSPGYIEKTTEIFLVSNFYDITTEELLWSAQSETYNPSSLKDLVASYSTVVVNEMAKEGVLK